MAYTYEQFESAASKAGLLNKFNKQDLIIAQSNPEYGISMLQLMKNRSVAKTAEQKVLADEAARQLRQTYGGYISGGRLPEYADEVIQQTENYYAGQNAYRKALATAEGYGDTAYDKKLGDIYARQSELERERARADALAVSSAATGGRPSSYALRAAQEAAGDQDAQLDETILGLRRNAYQQALSAVRKPSGSAGKGSNNTGTSGNNSGGSESDGKANKPVKDDSSKALAVSLGEVLGEASKVIISEAVNRNGESPDTAPLPEVQETDRVKAIAESIDGNLRIQQMTGKTKPALREQLLGYLNNDGFVGSLSEGEWAWLMAHYEEYELI